MPIANATDPLRGVSPGRVEMPSAQRSGLSATVGLALVVGLLLVAGTLAVSGGGILTSGGRLGVTPAGPGSPGPSSNLPVPTDEPALPLPTAESGEQQPPAVALTNVLASTCAPDQGAIRDANKAKWRISGLTAGDRSDTGTDRVIWELQRTGKGQKATQVKLEWLDIKQAKEDFGLTQLAGQRAVVITFDGPVDITVDQQIPLDALGAEGITAVRDVQQFVAPDGKVRTLIGVRGDGCATLEAPVWKKARNATQKSKVFFDIEKP